MAYAMTRIIKRNTVIRDQEFILNCLDMDPNLYSDSDLCDVLRKAGRVLTTTESSNVHLKLTGHGSEPIFEFRTVGSIEIDRTGLFAKISAFLKIL